MCYLAGRVYWDWRGCLLECKYRPPVLVNAHPLPNVHILPAMRPLRPWAFARAVTVRLLAKILRDVMLLKANACILSDIYR